MANIPRLSTVVLPPMLAAFHAEFPEVEVCLVEMEPAEQLEAVREKRIHLGIYPHLGATLHSRYGSRLIFSCPMVTVIPTGHRLARDLGEIDIHALAGETVLIPSTEAYGYIDRLEQLCAAANLPPPSRITRSGWLTS